MSLSINLAPIDADAAVTAETRTAKIIEFTKSLGHEDTFLAASKLLFELKRLNRCKIDADTRINILEQYRKIINELTDDLEEVFGNAPTPLSKENNNFAALAEALWLETGYGYKRALVDLKHKLINFKGSQQQSLVIYRAIEALKNEARVNYLTYKTPSESLWSDLHKLYFHALQLSLEAIEVQEKSAFNNKTINLVYIQTLLMHLANPQRLNKPSIRKLAHYIGGLAKFAQLHGMGYIENPVGVFMIELDSKKPPVPYQKNKNSPNVNTDILLLTVEVARQIHQQLKYIQNAQRENTEQLPNVGLEVVDEDLLTHLINYFGTTASRFFPRMEKKQPAELSVGIEAASILFRTSQRAKDNIISSWEIMNVSPVGYALKTNETHNLAVSVGDLVTIKESANNPPALGCIVWLNTKVDHMEAGIKLISPSAESVFVKSTEEKDLKHALLLPCIKTLKQPMSIIIERDYVNTGGIINISMSNKASKLKIKQLIERSPKFDRYEYSLIDDDLS
jgi:cyclic-di-GMP-binding protein